MLNQENRRVGVFIDVQNMYYSARNIFSRKVNFENIVKETVGDGRLVRARAFTISTEGGEEQAFFDALRKVGIEVVSKELLEYDSGAKKGDWDVGITIDIVRMLDMLDVVVLVSGDGDFEPLVRYIKGRGRIAHVASFRESTSTALVEAADTYTNLSDDKGTFLIGNRRASAKPSKTTKTATKRTTTKTAVVKGRKDAATAAKTDEKRRVTPPGGFLKPIVEEVGDIEESRTRRLTF